MVRLVADRPVRGRRGCGCQLRRLADGQSGEQWRLTGRGRAGLDVSHESVAAAGRVVGSQLHLASFVQFLSMDGLGSAESIMVGSLGQMCSRESGPD